MPNRMTFDPPQGVIKHKYIAARDNDDFPEEGIVGPVNCIAAETRLYDAELDRHVPIVDLMRQGRRPLVLAWDGESFVKVRASIPFWKGRAPLYRVRLSSGEEIVATDLHYFLTREGWRSLSTVREALRAGRPIALRAEPGLAPSSSAPSPSGSRRGAPRWTRTVGGWLDRCSAYLRPRDARPLRVQAVGRASVPSREGARERSLPGMPWGVPVASRSDTHGSASRHRSTSGASRQAVRPDSLGGSLLAPCTSGGISGPLGSEARWLSLRLSRLLRRASGWPRRTWRTWTGLSSAWPDYITVDSVEYERTDGYYDLHVPGLENYMAEGFVNHNTAKSNMLIDFLMRRAFDYPGSNALLARATLKALRDSTIVRLNQRWGSIFNQMGGSQNENQGIYRLPPAKDPVTGAPVQSTIRAIGLDRSDVDQLLRSVEVGTSAMDEADELPTDAIDMVQFRSRQAIFHKSKTVEDLCIKLSQQWGGVHPDDVLFILQSDKRHPVGQGQLPMDHPMPGTTVMKLAWNPTGDTPIWQRMVGLPYPDPHPSVEWVKNHIGVREVRVPYEKHAERNFRFVAGSIVQLSDGSRRFAAGHDEDSNSVYLVPDMKNKGARVKVPVEETMLVVQRNTIYVFTHENESRDFRNDERAFLAQNEGLAKMFFLGAPDKRSKRVFPDYKDDYVENGGHLIRWPEDGRRIVADKKWPIIGGLDKGGRHAHATTMSIVTPETGRAIIYGEYVRTGVGARDHALDSQAMILPGAPNVTWGYDPSLDARRYDSDAEYRTIEEYEEVLGQGNLFHGTRGDEGFELVQRLLMPYSGFIGEESAPRLLVFDHLKHVREAMLRLTWRMVDRERDNYLVDVGDAIKYMATVLQQISIADDAPVDIFEPRLAYRPR